MPTRAASLEALGAADVSPALAGCTVYLVDQLADMKFRPCIDIHDGVVKQIVGGTLKDAPVGASEAPKTNFVAEHPSDYFARFVQRA